MQLRWTEDDANDLEQIADYLFEHSPERAAKLVRKIYEFPAKLLAFPLRGRLGKKQGTRELILAPLPYIVIYSVRGDLIYIARILHGAQHRP